MAGDISYKRNRKRNGRIADYSSTPAARLILFLKKWLNAAMHLPTPRTDSTVPSPTPTRCPAKSRLMVMVMQMLQRSKQFFVNPTGLCMQSAIACTMPSPGFGMIRMFRDIAAPTPVRAMPKSRRISCSHRLFSGAGIHAENRFIKRVKIRLKGSCNRSISKIRGRDLCTAGSRALSAVLR